MQKRVKILLGIAVVIAVICMIPIEHPYATRVGDVIVNKIMTPPEGYSTTVCSSWVNNSNLIDGAATSSRNLDFSPPTGYYFEKIQVYAVKAGAAQYCSLRVHASASDSSLVSTKSNGLDAMPLNWQSGESGLVYEFNLRCTKATFNYIASTDDVYVIGYARNY